MVLYGAFSPIYSMQELFRLYVIFLKLYSLKKKGEGNKYLLKKIKNYLLETIFLWNEIHIAKY